MKVFKQEKRKIIRVAMQVYKIKPVYISFIETDLEKCYLELTSFLKEYLDKNMKASEIIDSKENVSISFIDTITKERKSFNIKGLNIQKLEDIILKKYE